MENTMVEPALPFQIWRGHTFYRRSYFFYFETQEFIDMSGNDEFEYCDGTRLSVIVLNDDDEPVRIWLDEIWR
jgi:hypothetical protein